MGIDLALSIWLCIVFGVEAFYAFAIRSYRSECSIYEMYSKDFENAKTDEEVWIVDRSFRLFLESRNEYLL